MEESTDSDFTITYEEIPRSFDQVSEEEGVGIGADMSGDSVSPERDNAEDKEQEEAAAGGKAKRLSPRERHRRQSRARNKKKQWGKEWML